MNRFVAPWLAAGILFASTTVRAAEATVADPEPVATISPEDALAHEGEECTVEMVVRAARKLPGKNVCFLNSMPDHRAEGNFTVVIFKAGLERLASDGIEDPAARFLDATIRVRGVVEKRDGRPQIVVDEPGQISIVEPDEAP